MRKLETLCCFVIVGLAVSQSAQARTLRVSHSPSSATSEHFATIQSAIDAANNNDLVYVDPGTYSGVGNRDIDFHGKIINVGTAAIPDGTIIDCGGTSGAHHGAFIFHSGESAGAFLQGFTIKNAYFATDGGVDTGAIHCESSSPQIFDCFIYNNNSHGITTANNAFPSVYTCVIHNNAGHGVALGVGGGSVGGSTLTQLTIYHNSRAGIALPWNISATQYVNSCTVFGNDSGGVRFVGATSHPHVFDTYLFTNLIAFNKVAGLQQVGPDFGGIKTLCNDIFGNTTNLLNIVFKIGDTTQNFSADPKFCDTALLKFTLQSNSPCLPGGGNPCNNQIGALGAGGCASPSCCVGMRGNIDCSSDNLVDISDLTALIDHMFISLGPLCCFDEANTDAAGLIDISDLTALIDHMFISLNPLPNCP